jgi:CheY-like chemotaxis protein
VQDKLFQPFIQAGPAISRGFGGTGLGLSICRAIVQAFQGRIGVESEPGKGATFWFIIPLPKADPLVDEPSVEPGALPMEKDLVGARVLLVEDNQVNRELGTLTLQMMGAEVLVAEDGVAAVQMVQNHPLDLILMDMHMPRMGGLAATRHLRAGGYDRPIVALTAAVLPEDREAAVEAGMDAFATKPINPTRLLEAIQQALRARDGTA